MLRKRVWVGKVVSGGMLMDVRQSVVLQHFGNTSCIFWTFFPFRGVTDEQFYGLGGH